MSQILAVRGNNPLRALERIEWPAELAVAGEATVDVVDEIPVRATVGATGSHVTGVDSDADVIVVQNPLDRFLAESVVAAKREGRRIVVDVDVDWWTIPPHAAGHRSTTSLHSSKKWLDLAVSAADLITVPSARLLDRFAGTDVEATVLRPKIPEQLIVDPETITGTGPSQIVWYGSTADQPDDLGPVSRPVRELLRTGRARLTIIGPEAGIARAFGAPFDANSFWISGELEPMAAFELLAARAGQIGIAPFKDVVFNKARGWSWPLLYAACGLVPVMSPLPEHELLKEEHGIGVLVDQGSDWRSTLTRLSVRSDERLDLARAAATGVGALTFEAAAAEWALAWLG